MTKKTIRTMEEFASAVGLSRPTVSKYFQDPGSVRPKVRQRIEVGLDETGFRPNLLAINLNRRRTRIIGLVFPNSLDPFYMGLRQFIEAKAREAGYLSFVFSSEGNPELEEEAIETLVSLNAAGVVMAPVDTGGQNPKLKRLAHKLPTVFIDVAFDAEETFVGNDNHQSIELMVDYLSRFKDPPCYFGGPPVNRSNDERLLAYEKTMQARGLEPIVLDIGRAARWDFESYGYEQAKQILASGGFPTRSILCINDRVAFGVLAAAYEAGKKVGIETDCDLRVAGHDDHPLARFAVPPLTTVAQDTSKIGAMAIERLFAKIEGETATGVKPLDNQVRVHARLVLRASA